LIRRLRRGVFHPRRRYAASGHAISARYFSRVSLIGSEDDPMRTREDRLADLLILWDGAGSRGSLPDATTFCAANSATDLVADFHSLVECLACIHLVEGKKLFDPPRTASSRRDSPSCSPPKNG